MSRIASAVVNEVYKRAGMDDTLGDIGPYCEACGGPGRTSDMVMHHRLLRSAGGKDTAENIMLVHGGITGGCHNLSEHSIHQNTDRSYALGHLVRRGHDPAQHPFRAFRDLRAVRAAPCPEPECGCFD